MKGKSRFLEAALFSILFLVVCWSLFLTEEYLGIQIKKYGLIPREAEGLIGIVSMHFLHGDWKHLLNNSLSFLILNTILFYFYRQISIKVFLYLLFAGGILLWIGGRPSNHIGASLIIFGQAAFLFFSGVFRKDPTMLRVGLMVAFYYGSMVWWLFPIDPTISWEGHLSGAIVGVILAFVLRKSGPQRRKHRYELEEEYEQSILDKSDEDIEVFGVEEIKLPENDPIEINYHYKSKKE